MLNHVTMIGRLTRDPELRYTPQGHPVAHFTLAIDQPFKNAQGDRKADFIDIAAWRKLAEIVSQYVGKNQLLAIEGRLEIRSYTDSQEIRRKSATVGTEERVEELAQAQRRTEDALQGLAHQVGQLSDTIGYSIEDLARDLAPDRLAQRHGITVSSLERAFFRIDGQEIELDFYGLGQRGGERIAILGEAKSRIYGRDVEALSERARQLTAQIPGTPLPVLFGFVIHPSAKEAASRLGAIVVASRE